ncbi:MAG TPA: Mur ligase domain-containing protein, partial [Caulobacter sp.]|nr:Mur ligase domain-containing protein [Caulobacter sp.]
MPESPVITGVTADSRKVGPGTLFAALPGTKVDGSSFAPGAIAAGAAAVLGPVGMETFSVPTVKVEDPRRAY